jgi:hypothetical protein
MPFHQTYNAPIGRVINNDGTLILNESSKAPDVARVLAEQQELIEQNLPEPLRKEAVEKIKAAIAEANKPKPDKAKVTDYVNDTAKIVEGASKTASGLVSLGETLFKIGTWVAAFL